MTHPFPPTALWRRHAKMVRDISSIYKIEYFILVKNSLNPEGHQYCITGSKVILILLDGGYFPYWWSCIGKGLRLQPVFNYLCICLHMLPNYPHLLTLQKSQSK